MEKTLQYSSRCTVKRFYFLSKVSVQRAVLHGQAPYQQCFIHAIQFAGSKISENTRVSLRASPEKFPILQAAKTKVHRVHPESVNPRDFQRQSKPSRQAPVSFTSLYVMLAETAEDACGLDLEADLSVGLSFLLLDQQCSLAPAPVAYHRGGTWYTKTDKRKEPLLTLT